MVAFSVLLSVSSISTHSWSWCACHLAFNSLQSYKARYLKKFVTCFRFQESAHSVAFLKFFSFLHSCLCSLEGSYFSCFTHSWYFTGHSDSRRLEFQLPVPEKEWGEDKTAHQKATESIGLQPESCWPAVRSPGARRALPIVILGPVLWARSIWFLEK